MSSSRAPRSTTSCRTKTGCRPWWQRVSGDALHGPLQGDTLEPLPWDEVTFTVFKQEHPDGLVLIAVDEYKDEYASSDWEREIRELPTVTREDPCRRLQPRDLVVGIASGGVSMAYTWKDLTERRLIEDTVGGTPVLLVMHPDGLSLRCFDRRITGAVETFHLRRACPPVTLEEKTGSAWDFSGLATSGPRSGSRLERLPCHKDFWFDWRQYNRDAVLFSAEQVAAMPGAAN